MPASLSMEMASAYLKQVNENGVSLYQHLADLLEMIDQSDDQTMDLEKLSIQAKMKSSIKQSNNQTSPQSINQSIKQSINQSVNQTYLKNQSKLMESMIATTHTEYQSINQPINQTINKTINRTKAPLTDFRVQNIQSLTQVIKQSGLNIDCDAVQLAMNQLALNLSNNQTIKQSINQPINNLSFWGVIRGLQSDYYVMECTLKPNNKQSNNQTSKPSTGKSKIKPFVDKSEIRGAGINQSIYFVSNSLIVSSDQISQSINQSNDQSINQSCWTLLPDANAELITKSRKFHRFLTGNLNASITGNPAFTQTINQTVNQTINGCEAMYLRCQIARIQHSAFVAPKGAFTTVEVEVNEESNNPNNQTSEYVDLDPAFEGADSSINQLDSWTYIRGKILKPGRTTPWVEPEAEEEEEESNNQSNNQEEEEEDEVPGLLSSIDPEAGLFNIRTVNQSNNQTKNETINQSINSSINQSRHPRDVTIVQSVLWPGAYSINQSINQSIKSINFYIGYGVKRQSRPFLPAAMPSINQEFNEISTEDVTDEEQPINLLAEQIDPVLTVDLNEDEENNGDEDEEGEEEDEDQ